MCVMGTSQSSYSCWLWWSCPKQPVYSENCLEAASLVDGCENKSPLMMMTKREGGNWLLYKYLCRRSISWTNHAGDPVLCMYVLYTYTRSESRDILVTRCVAAKHHQKGRCSQFSYVQIIAALVPNYKRRHVAGAQFGQSLIDREDRLGKRRLIQSKWWKWMRGGCVWTTTQPQHNRKKSLVWESLPNSFESPPRKEF